MNRSRFQEAARFLPRTASLALLIAATGAGLPLLAQSAEYMVVPLGTVPDAYSTIPTGMNDLGQVVGWSQFFGTNAGLKAWMWTPESGFTPLPPPPGMTTSYRAIDINDSGVIAGDGGYDSGQSWRFVGGTYEILGTLDGDPISWTAGINETGDIAGTSRGSQFIIPYKAFLDTEPDGLTQILSSATSGYLNDAGQVVGWSQSNAAFVHTPGVGVEFLGDLGGRQLTYAYGINEKGEIAGEAAYATGNGHVPFLFTPDGGMQELGNLGAQAGARSINDRGEVVGDYELSSGPHPWIWTAQNGVRFLEDLIGTTDFTILAAPRINESGIILVRVLDLATTGDRMPALLVPFDAETQVRFRPDQVTLEWYELPGAARYNVYRGALADLSDADGDGLPDQGYGDCVSFLDPDTSDGTFSDPDVPAIGSASFYVVACVDETGREFGLGATSAGSSRSASLACP